MVITNDKEKHPSVEHETPPKSISEHPVIKIMA